MKRLLVSVRNAAEARIALDSGVDLIDIKEPNRGALGAADAAVWHEVLHRVDGRVPVSCALGELAEASDASPRVPAGMAFVKVGLAGAATLPAWRQRWAALLAMRPHGCQAAAVVYADWRAAGAPSPDEMLQQAVALGCSALLVDTFDKRRGDVFQHWPLDSLHAFLNEATHGKLTTLLGGGLTWDSLDPALATPADYLAVRGIVCSGNRTGVIEEQLCRQLAEQLHGNSTRAGAWGWGAK